ncbi:MAG: LapA family protein [Bacteroidetes bacterium]|nr:LapA family protein [Bacteroidota bacterium]
MKKLTALLAIPLLLLGFLAHGSLPAQTTLDSLLTLPKHEKFYMLEKIMVDQKRKNSDSYFEYINGITYFFIQKGKRSDLLLIQLACFSDTSNHGSKPEKVLHWGFSIANEARTLRDTFALGVIHQRIGSYYYIKLDDHINTFRQLWTVKRLIQHLSPEDFPEKNYDTYYLARSYFDFFDYENAIRQGKPLMNVSPEKITSTHIFNTCLLGMSYYYLKNPVEARRYFLWGLRYVPEVFMQSTANREIGWTGIFYGDIGLTYFQEKNYEQAIPYLTKGFDLTTQTKYWNNVPLFGAKLARIYLEKSQLTKALEYASWSIEAAQKLDTIIYPRSRFIAEPYEVMAEYYRRAKRPAYALAYADSARQAHQQWKQIFDVGQKHLAEVALAKEEFMTREVRVAADKERLITYRNRLTLSVLVGVALCYLLYLGQQIRLYIQLQRLARKKQRAEEELLTTQLQLGHTPTTTPAEGLTTFSTDQRFTTYTVRHPSTQPPLIHELRQAVLLTDDDWDHFVQLFEKVHPGFFVRLRYKLPDLTPAEVRFLALSRLGYSNREMATMLGVGPGAIRQYRLRLRRKLHLPDHIEIEEMVAVI